MARWWTKPPITIAALGVLAVIITALLPRTTITQQTAGSGSPVVGSAGRDVTITQQPISPPPTGQNPATPPPQLSPPAMPTPSGQPWWQQPPVIVGIIGVIATLIAALIQRPRTPSPAEAKPQRPRRKS